MRPLAAIQRDGGRGEGGEGCAGAGVEDGDGEGSGDRGGGFVTGVGLDTDSGGTGGKIEIRGGDVGAKGFEVVVIGEREINRILDVKEDIAGEAALDLVEVGTVPLVVDAGVIAGFVAGHGLGHIVLEATAGGVVGGDGDHVVAGVDESGDVVGGGGSAALVVTGELSVDVEVDGLTDGFEGEEDFLIVGGGEGEVLAIEHETAVERGLAGVDAVPVEGIGGIDGVGDGDERPGGVIVIGGIERLTGDLHGLGSGGEGEGGGVLGTGIAPVDVEVERSGGGRERNKE